MFCYVTIALLVGLQLYSAEGAAQNIGAACNTTAGDTCPANANCTGSPTTCTCDNGFTASSDNTTCVEVGFLGGPCVSTSDCTAKDPNSECTMSVCNCTTDHIASGRTCKAKVGTACTLTGSTHNCVTGARCSSTGGNCTCEAGKTANVDKTECTAGAPGVVASLALQLLLLLLVPSRYL